MRVRRGVGLTTYLIGVLVVIFAAAGCVMILNINAAMKAQARVEAEAKALTILNHNLAVHTYFTKELKPCVFACVEGVLDEDAFQPEWMSSTFAVRAIEGYAAQLSGSDYYYYKECAINARSPSNEADEHEAAFLRRLQSDPDLISEALIRNFNGEPYFTVLRRGEAMEEVCLRCHSEPENAPAELVARYGPDRSFGRYVGQVVQAMSIRIPLSKAYAAADHFATRLSEILVAVMVLALFCVLGTTRRLFIGPIGAMRDHAVAVARGEIELGSQMEPPLPAELHDLSLALNGMSTELARREEDLGTLVEERTEELRAANEHLRDEMERRADLEKGRLILERQVLKTEKLESLAALAGGVAHDFNNLLAVVLGHAELALDEVPDSARAAASLRTIIDSATRGGEVSRRMLAYTGQSMFMFGPVVLTDVVEAVVEGLAREFPPGVDVVLDFTDERSPVRGDVRNLSLAIREFLLNATEAMGEGGGTVTVRVARHARPIADSTEAVIIEPDAAPEAVVSLTIEDTGHGMDQETLRRAFEPFFSTRFPGRGLGLAAAFGIIRAHEGWLSVRSTPGEGTRIRLMLSCLPGEADHRDC